MLTQDCKVVWYGKLKIGAKTTLVVFDPQITPSIKGCIYLYNADRDAIVQYTWDIVQRLLADLDKTEKNTLKKSLDAKWKIARKKFTKGRVYSLTSGGKSEPRPSVPAETDERRWDAADDDSFELEDLG